MTNKSDICPKCGGTFLYEYGISTCVNCSNEKVDRHARTFFIQVNTKEILQDAADIGSKKTIKKWRISGSTLWKLKKKYGPVQVDQDKPALAKVPNNGLPELPAFNDQWDPSVQVKWLEVYQGLRK